jgi:integrative and conjugative element protein (TIGR02256 family)
MTRVEHIILHAQALMTIQQESLVSATDGNETGGILLGSRSETGDVQVCFAGTPGPAAIRRPNFFLRDLQHTQTFANRHYFDDGVVWIGEWHTHPHNAPIPSQQDLTTYAHCSPTRNSTSATNSPHSSSDQHTQTQGGHSPVGRAVTCGADKYRFGTSHR